jgi:hypothetical protein
MAVTYAFLDYTNTRWNWAYDYRSIPTIVLPVALFGLLELWRRSGGRQSRLFQE